MNEDIHSSKMVNPLIDRSNTKSLLTCMVHIYIYIYIYIYIGKEILPMPVL
jgi:hypothetical protein